MAKKRNYWASPGVDRLAHAALMADAVKGKGIVSSYVSHVTKTLIKLIARHKNDEEVKRCIPISVFDKVVILDLAPINSIAEVVRVPMDRADLNLVLLLTPEEADAHSLAGFGYKRLKL
jgi:hypothetical protein